MSRFAAQTDRGLMVPSIRNADKLSARELDVEIRRLTAVVREGKATPVGRIIDKPWVVDGELAVRQVTELTLTSDHRVCDGGTAAGFLRLVADAIENPGSVLADM